LTDRLYYTDSFLQQFDAHVVRVDGETGAITLDRSAFYPTSGGQLFDTGWLDVTGAGGIEMHLRVKDVAEDGCSGDVLHLVAEHVPALPTGAAVRGAIDAERRRDHMQQHSGQHVLSAAFERLYGFVTVSFHMGDESCTIDLATAKLSPKQIEAAECLANEIIAEDRGVEIRFATPQEARDMGVRKIPLAEREKLRLIDIQEFDLNACGGTHVRSTGQIGGLLLRKTEKVKQGVRVEFVCGLRAVRTARRDFQTLADAAALFSTHTGEVPQQVQKALDEIRAGQKAQHRLVEEVAELLAERLLGSAKDRSGHKLVVQFLPERDLGFVKMLAQKLTRAGKAVALLGCGGSQPSVVFAQTPGLPHDMGALMRQTVERLGTRGGGARDMSQGGVADAASAEQALCEAANEIG